MMNYSSLAWPPRCAGPDRQSVFKWFSFFSGKSSVYKTGHYQVILHSWRSLRKYNVKNKTLPNASPFPDLHTWSRINGTFLRSPICSPTGDKPILIMTKLNTAIFLKSGLALQTFHLISPLTEQCQSFLSLSTQPSHCNLANPANKSQSFTFPVFLGWLSWLPKT